MDDAFSYGLRNPDTDRWGFQATHCTIACYDEGATEKQVGLSVWGLTASYYGLGNQFRLVISTAAEVSY